MLLLFVIIIIIIIIITAIIIFGRLLNKPHLLICFYFHDTRPGAFSEEYQAIAQPRAENEVGNSLLVGSSFLWQSKLGKGLGDYEPSHSFLSACHTTKLFGSLLTERQCLEEPGASKFAPDPW